MEDDKIVILPDGSAFATMSYPLPHNHWIYGDKSVENDGFEPPPMPFRMGTRNPIRKWFAKKITSAAQYAIRSSTMCGRETDFDPDAMVQNFIVGLLGYYTSNGLSSDLWANPPRKRSR